MATDLEREQRESENSEWYQKWFRLGNLCELAFLLRHSHNGHSDKMHDYDEASLREYLWYRVENWRDPVAERYRNFDDAVRDLVFCVLAEVEA